MLNMSNFEVQKLHPVQWLHILQRLHEVQRLTHGVKATYTLGIWKQEVAGKE